MLLFQPCLFMTNLAPATMMTRTTTQLRFPIQLILDIGKFQQWWSPSRFPTVGEGVREICWASTQLPPQTSSMWCSVCRFNESPQFGAWATTWRGWPRALGRAEKLIVLVFCVVSTNSLTMGRYGVGTCPTEASSGFQWSPGRALLGDAAHVIPVHRHGNRNCQRFVFIFVVADFIVAHNSS